MIALILLLQSLRAAPISHLEYLDVCGTILEAQMKAKKLGMCATYEIVGNDLSDGYHTFNELYLHRIILYLALAKTLPYKKFFKKDYSEWFCLYIETPHGQVSYHLPNVYLEDVKSFAEESPEHPFDGHTSADVIHRISKIWSIE